MMSDLAQQLNGGGGSVEQTYVYLDHKSALDWIQLCNTPSYVAAFRESMPQGAVAKRIRELVGQVRLDLIALGPGDGKSEVRLVQHIIEESERPNIRFYLLSYMGHFPVPPHRAKLDEPPRAFLARDERPDKPTCPVYQSAFAGAASGDLLLFDADYAFTTSIDSTEIERADLALSKPVPEGHQRWLAGPIRRYCPDVQDKQLPKLKH